MTLVMTLPHRTEPRALVYCPICTHTVEAKVEAAKRGTQVVPGQKCQRCHSSLDAGYVVRVERAA